MLITNMKLKKAAYLMSLCVRYFLTGVLRTPAAIQNAGEKEGKPISYYSDKH